MAIGYVCGSPMTPSDLYPIAMPASSCSVFCTATRKTLTEGCCDPSACGAGALPGGWGAGRCSPLPSSSAACFCTSSGSTSPNTASTRGAFCTFCSYQSRICWTVNPSTFLAVPIGRNWYGELSGPKNSFLKNRIIWCSQSASSPAMAASIRFFIAALSSSGNDGLFTTSAYASNTLPKSCLRQFVPQDQVLLPQVVSIGNPTGSKNSAIWAALRVLVPRVSISIVRLPSPLVCASSAVTPPALYIWIVISG